MILSILQTEAIIRGSCDSIQGSLDTIFDCLDRIYGCFENIGLFCWAFWIVCNALLMGYRAPVIAYWSLWILYVAGLIECMAVL